MLKKKIFDRLLVLGIVGSITISSGVVAFADSVKGTGSLKSKIEGKFGIAHKEGAFKGNIQKGGMQKSNFLAEVLTTQVKAGVITQAEADKVTAFLKTKEDAKIAKMKAEKTKFDAMTDAEKKSALEAKKAAKTAEKAKLEAMTEEQRAAYMKANRPDDVNIFAEIVTAGILTQDKADKVKAAMPQKFDKGLAMGKEQGIKGERFGKQPGSFLGTGLTNQVTAGIVTQAEADKITAFLKTKEDAMKAKMDAERAKLNAMTDAEKKAEKAKIEAMTAEERTAYMKANRPTEANIFSELVTNGILTQDKADKLKAALPQKMRDQGRHKGEKPVEGANTNSL